MNRLAFAIALAVAAQEPARPSSFSIGSETTLLEVLEKALPLLERRVIYPSSMAASLKNLRAKVEQPVDMNRGNAEAVLGRLFLARGFALLPPILADMPWEVVDLKGADRAFVVARSRCITPEEIDAYAERYTVVSVVLTLRHASADDVQSAVEGLLLFKYVESAGGTGRRMCVIGLGPTVAKIARTLRELDDAKAKSDLQEMKARVTALEAELAEKTGTKPPR